MSRYYLDKFLYRVDRNPALLLEYMRDPAAFVPRWEHGEGRQLMDTERTSGLHFTDEERRALVGRDILALYALGAHAFLLLTIMIPVYEDQFPDFPTFAHEFRNTISDLGLPGLRSVTGAASYPSAWLRRGCRGFRAWA
jgi:hypothetical protein